MSGKLYHSVSLGLFWVIGAVGNTVVHDFNGHEVNGIHGLNGKKCYDKALYLMKNGYDFKGMHDFKGNFPYDDFFRKTHARL